MKNHRKTLESPITVVGPAATVEKAKAQEQIGQLWGQAGEGGALSQPAAAFGVYSHYEDRLASRYRVTVGQAEEGAATAESITIPAGEYVVFEQQGPAPEVVAQMWSYVWTKWADRDQRSFEVDFEQHEGTPADAKVTLYIGVKPRT